MLEKLSPFFYFFALISIGYNFGKGKADFLDYIFAFILLVLSIKDTMNNFKT